MRSTLRVLFFLLLLVNAAFLGWQLFAPPSTPRSAAQPQPTGPLRLLSELGPDQIRMVARAPAASARSSHCYRLGPIDDEGGSASTLEASLVKQGYKVDVLRQEQLEPLGWWVYLPPAPSLAEAQALAARLAERGIDDHVLVVGQEKANAVSLGLFPNRVAASERITQLRALGFEPQIEQRYARRAVALLTVRGASSPPAAVAADGWEQIDCQGGGD